MKISNTIIALTTGLLISACATQTGWTPTVDTYNNPNSFRLSQDMAECDQLARQASGGTGMETAKGAGVGALLGGATGAAIGAIAGSPGTGAAIGATAGAMGGGSKMGIDSEDRFKRAYKNCLRNRGHNVID
ncbi:MAG: glycine zipper family protein [Methylicorpusculum sp.]|uniref:glycine zipper family protein n=1 Tax=Methylicorpusculum sp. TaxID=2713644 RepID=UPI00272249D7|nr:glycine zipper family protein [Methylicorpusculum sp.]MDO8845308.1 glycine zipper family protein [Methylicorpusculum sp.]MDO8940951.1 glycine zipper family protein [Methylicorpusculum sp.]MDO9239160.1 glycine zipper family protein [Methylicorpusculum sp.]MDP2200844.1 glycine zipper family protein [Methylicorpusculum sp.]